MNIGYSYAPKTIKKEITDEENAKHVVKWVKKDDLKDFINIDIFKIPVSKLGSFMSNVSAPLSIGNVELIDGRWVKGFLCEEYAVKDAEDITSKKSF